MTADASKTQRSTPTARSSHFPDGNLDQRCGPKQNGVQRLSAAMLSNSIEQSRSNAMRDWTLIEIQPQPETVCISPGRTVVITGLDGFVSQDSHQGLWIYQSRALSKYRWTIDDRPPQLSAFSAVHENSSIAYYISAPTNWKKTGAKTPDPAQQAIELRVTRRAGNGTQEDVFVINHTQVKTKIDLALEVASDFMSPIEDPRRRSRVGKVSEHWRSTGPGLWELVFDYQARHDYHHQKDKGSACLHRSLSLQVKCNHSKLKYRKGKITFQFTLPPHGEWRQHLDWIPGDGIEDARKPISLVSIAEQDRKRVRFLVESTQLGSPGSPTFPALVINTLDRSKRDLAALRLSDLDGRDEAGETWIPAAGIPTYVGLFGRDSLASSWQAALLSTSMMRGALAELPKTQGTKIDDWRDEQPGRFVHELQ